MTSRDRVLTTFEFQEPDRVPMWCGSSEEFWVKSKNELGLDDEGLRIRYHDDFRRVYAVYAGPKFSLSAGATCRTVFGVERTGLGYGQPITHPLSKAESALDSDAYEWPDPDWMDVSGIKDAAASYGRQYAILGGDWSPFWHDAIDLLGMENMYMKMYDCPELVDSVMTHLVDFYAAVNQKIFDAAADEIDIFFIGNDLGSKNGPLLGPDMFNRFVLPHVKRLIDMAKQYNLKTQMHCCGGFAPLIPSLIDAGLDAVHAVQSSCVGMDLNELKREFGGKLVFNGGIDSHHVLIDGNPESVRKDTMKVLDIMKPGGGFIAGASHDTILEETPVENVIAMFDTIQEYGVY